MINRLMYQKSSGYTLKELKQAGYYVYDYKLFRGYVSRKADIDNQPVFVAAGYRENELYIEFPNYKSTMYSYRAYLKSDTNTCYKCKYFSECGDIERITPCSGYSI